jgi:uncharacterized protein
MGYAFEWDSDKAVSNQKKHRIAFDEAKTIFGDPNELTIYDEDHSAEEDRYISLGRSSRGRLIVVSYTERDDRIRIISARPANRRERNEYEKADKEERT